MTTAPADKTTDRQSLCCPTCGAHQAWADLCRRCRCDLWLVHRLLRRRHRLHQTCLFHLRAGRFAAALTTARALYRLSPDVEASRLLAVCHLVNGHFSAALDVYYGAGVEVPRRRWR